MILYLAKCAKMLKKQHLILYLATSKILEHMCLSCRQQHLSYTLGAVLGATPRMMNSIPYHPWDWYIYLHLPYVTITKSTECRYIYSSYTLDSMDFFSMTPSSHQSQHLRDESLSLATTWSAIRPQKRPLRKGRESNLEIQTSANGRHNQANGQFGGIYMYLGNLL